MVSTTDDELAVVTRYRHRTLSLTGLREFSFLTGIILVSLVFSMLATTWLFLALGMEVSELHAPLAVCAAVALLLVTGALRGYATTVLAASLLSSAAIVVLCLTIATFFFDKSYDGQAYHQEAVLQLVGGWNPMIDELPMETPHRLWLTHYPKGPWLEAAAIYAATGKIESGKAVNLLLLTASFFLCWTFLLRLPRCPAPMALALALAAAFNPVSMYQSLSYYVDGQLASLVLALSAMLAMTFLQPRPSVSLAIFMLLVLAVNVKFTGFVYGSLLVASFALALYLVRGFRVAIPRSMPAVAGLLAGGLVLGFNPYVTNTFAQGHPFYPLFGDGRIDTSGFRAESLKDLNRVEALAVSMFSASQHRARPYELKWPFQVSKSELSVLHEGDDLIGGWAPLFSGLVMASLAAFAMYLLLGYSGAPQTKWILFAAAALSLTVMVNTEAWWARYTPQLYFIPLLLILALTLTGTRWGIVTSTLVLLIAFANAGMVLYSYLIHNYRTSGDIRAALAEIGAEGEPAVVHFGPFASTRVRLTEAGIEYREVSADDALPCLDPMDLPGSLRRVKVCIG